MNSVLELHRASAGSGKTFTLAKKFLWFYLTIQVEGAPRRLRRPEELSDSLSHILAVTFTNKATNEMQSRIVEKLNALAYPKINYNSPGYDPDDKERPKAPDYQQQFCEELGVTPETLALRCRTALSVMLNHYSDFQVSTIDAFFQTVLRTFVYETELKDGYGIELDQDFLIQTGINGMFESIEDNTAKSEVKYWIQKLMEQDNENAKSWNIFTRSKSQASYDQLIRAIQRLENEEFKVISGVMDTYFEQYPNLTLLYEECEQKYAGKLDDYFKDMKRLARKAEKREIQLGANLTGTLTSYVKGHVKSLNELKKGHKLTSKLIDEVKWIGKGTKRNQETEDFFYSYYQPLVEAYQKIDDYVNSPDYKLWKIYAKNFPWLGLYRAVNEKRQEYLRDSNNIELSQTNELLNKVIGEDDTPFVYERLGTRLDHYLIDEFQDTSRLQWKNFKSLLEQSLSNNNENLIIGDPKQCIYRFRNADPSLISQIVPNQFAMYVETHGDVPQENTNWRSDLNVVEFNNKFYHYLVDKMETERDRVLAADETKPARYLDFRNLYRNVVQNPKKTDTQGYVEAVRVEGAKNGVGVEVLCTQHIIPTIADLLKRGYTLADIVVLVSANDDADAIIEYFDKYNATLAEGETKIEYINEKALLLQESPAVKFLILMLETIAYGDGVDSIESRNVKENDEDGKGRRKRLDWNRIKTEFLIYLNNDSGLSVAEQLEQFIVSEPDLGRIDHMLADMQAVVLPAVIEGMVAEFLTPEMRQRDAAYIAAFQDVVLEYCASNPADIGSFLRYWEMKREKLAISSPEGVNAIRMMTIHKSKGLEFPVVLMPFVDYSIPDKLSSTRGEWRWVKPQLPVDGEQPLPTLMPISVNSALQGTPHESEYIRGCDLATMDSLNKLYVGTTRAVNELYIYEVKGKNSTDKLALDYLFEMMEQPQASKVTYGEKYAVSPVKRKLRDAVEIKEYSAAVTPDFLKYEEKPKNPLDDAEDEEVEEVVETELMPFDASRKQGTLLHSVMERIVKREDLTKAVKRAVMDGRMNRKEGMKCLLFLNKCLNKPEVKPWFDGGYKVLIEQSLILPNKVRRPDRVMITPGGEAIVVDYKFGEHVDSKQYRKQVLDYIYFLKRTGKFKNVRGYLWYLAADVLEEVTAQKTKE